MKFITTFIFILLTVSTIGQTNQFKISKIDNFFNPNHFEVHQHLSAPGLQSDGIQPMYLSKKMEIPVEAEPFLAFSVVWNVFDWSDDLELYIRFSDDGANWTTPQKVNIDNHNPNTENRKISQLYYQKKAKRFFKFRIQSKNPYPEFAIENLEFHFYNPKITTNEIETPEDLSTSNNLCPCPQPNILNRSDWCPAGDCPPNSNPTTTNVTHLIIHHSAGSNVASDWSAVVRSIWNYHVNTNGWSDIGYNWLVAPDGTMYEGRGANTIGAHFCGNNSNTAGICMIGNYMLTTPTTSAENALVQLLAWESCQQGLNPLDSAIHNGLGSVINRISGHRDGCTTSCPGDMFHPQLPQIRTDVDNYINTICNNLTAPTNLSSSISNQNTILLNWADNSTVEDSFVIERSESVQTVYVPIGSVPADTTHFEDATVQAMTNYYYRVKAINTNGNSPYTNEVNEIIMTSNTNNLSQNQFRVYPNPASNLVFVETFDIDTKVELYNVSGQQMMVDRQVNQKTIQLDLTTLSKGIYFLHVIINNDFQVVKVLVE